MPKFFFHIRDGSHLIPDEDGIEMEDLAAALSEAEAGALDMLDDARLEGTSISHQTVEVHDDQGRLVGRVDLKLLSERIAKRGPD